jgi:hypothetical protein
MVDIAAVTGLATSIRAAIEITKAMKDVHDATVLQTKTFELTREILSAQSYAMEAVAAQSALLDLVRQLEKEKAELEAWESEKKRYKLEDVDRGFFAYVLKPGMENGEPPHAICATCYQHSLKSILQSSGHIVVHEHYWFCGECDTKVKSQWRSMAEMLQKARERKSKIED